MLQESTAAADAEPAAVDLLVHCTLDGPGGGSWLIAARQSPVAARQSPLAAQQSRQGDLDQHQLRRGMLTQELVGRARYVDAGALAAFIHLGDGSQ